MKTPAQGAGTPIYLASAPEVEGITSRYYANRKPKTSSKASHDTTAAARLWQASACALHDSNRLVALAQTSGSLEHARRFIGATD